QKIRSS
ncbi:prismane/CO dehydrogenase family protein, partial [Vibrio parahaemolyticus V-223/04]